MKKRLLCVAFCVITIQQHEVAGNPVFQEIVNYHTRAFDCKNLYEKSLDASAISRWHNAMMNVGEFLKNTAQKQRELLVNYFVEMHKINQCLINTIKKAYAAKSNQICDTRIHQELSNKCAEMEKRARYIQKTLYWVDDTNFDDAQAIKCTQHLAQFIAATARKARLNLY